MFGSVDAMERPAASYITACPPVSILVWELRTHVAFATRRFRGVYVEDDLSQSLRLQLCSVGENFQLASKRGRDHWMGLELLRVIVEPRERVPSNHRALCKALRAPFVSH